MTALEAALKVLQEVGTPLHYREITRRILKTGLWHTEGKTPEATISAHLGVDVKQKGVASAFRRAGRGLFALNTERSVPVPGLGNVVQSEEQALYVAGRSSGAVLSFTDAGERILEAAGGKPMHYRDITRHALEHHMIENGRQDPRSNHVCANPHRGEEAPTEGRAAAVHDAWQGHVFVG